MLWLYKEMGWEGSSLYEHHTERGLRHRKHEGFPAEQNTPCNWRCRQMGWENSNPYEYHPERGLYYHEVTRNLVCGSQPQTREDIEHLHFQENVTNIVNLQVGSIATL